VDGVDAGQPGASLTVADVGSGKDILDWVHSGLIDSVFGDVKCTSAGAAVAAGAAGAAVAAANSRPTVNSCVCCRR
jgi:hypothetical protein